MSIKRQAIQGVFWSGIQNWGSQTGSLITFFVLARLLSPADFGLVALANTFLTFFNIFVNQGFTSALIQRQDIEAAHLNTAFWMQVCLGCCFTIIEFSCADIIAALFEQPLLVPILRGLSILFLIRSLNMVQRALLRRKLEFKSIAIRTLASTLISGVVGIALAVSNSGVWSLVGQQLAFEIVGAIAVWWCSERKPAFQFSLTHLKDLFSFGISILSSNVLIFFNQNTDNLLIGYFLGEVALGYYSVAYRVLQVLTQLLVHTSNQVALPILSRLQSNPTKLIEAFYKITQFSGLVALPIFLGVITLASELVIVIFGEKWEASIPIMQILALGGIIHLILAFNRSIFVALGKPFIKLQLDFVNVFFNVVACLVAVHWGLLAVAFAYITSDFLIVPGSLWALGKLLKTDLKAYLKQFILPIFCSIIMIGLMFLEKYYLTRLLVEPQMVLLICTLSGILCYSHCLKRLSPSHINELWNLASRDLVNNQEIKISLS